MRNHTGTHLLHRALRNTLGESARQAGSLVTPEYLRFDYPSDRGLTPDERHAIEREVRGVIREDRAVTPTHMRMAEAIEAGADAFFDEKYGETVRTVRVEGYSHELCGGTHCRSTGQIGGFIITAERSIGAGMRRIEAVTGEAAEALAEERFRLLDQAVAVSGARSAEQLSARIEELREQARSGRSAGTGRPSAQASARAAEQLLRAALVAQSGGFRSMEDLKAWAREVRGSLPSGVIVGGLDEPEGGQLFVTVSPDLVAQGIDAATLVREVVSGSGGRGGGRPEMAQGRVPDAAALAAAIELLRQRLAG
jgi:alanyl-tRNA synthetase